MALASTSSLADIKAQYMNNAGYEAAGSAAMAWLFAEACRCWLLNPTRTAGGDGGEIQFDPKTIERQMEKAEVYARKSTSGRVRYASFEDFRD